jgi:predicted GNAT family acetyltransferase
MTLKETIIVELQKLGYDTITACNLASDKIKEIVNYPKGKHKIYIDKTEISFTII